MTGLHDDRCASKRGHECNCPSAAFQSSASPACSKALTLDEDKLKEIATDFFRWWYNQPGANTDQGFDEWLRLNRARFGL